MFCSKYFALVLFVGTLAIASADEIEEIEIPFSVTIKPGEGVDGEEFRLTVEPSDTIDTIKTMIALRSKVTVGQQQLELAGELNVPLNDDNRTLSSYKINQNSVIILYKVESPKPTWFGVDIDDHEGVHAKVRELGDEQWRKMFGDDVDVGHIFNHQDWKDDDVKLHEGIKQAFGWLYNLVTGKKQEKPKSDE